MIPPRYQLHFRACPSKPDARLLSWIDAADEGLLYLSVLTLGEIRKGIAARPASKRRVRLESWFQVELRGRFSGHILPINLEIADRWGLIAATAKKPGRPLIVIDGLLAATALHHNLALVSRNAADVAHVAVQFINPWTS
ncbi:MAG TPA: type II toxin-antitoxin system VapC family toxin [Verrucomicrobiae bacterium]|nr:type II toxin-antitoxin system VapC family toxin [Verrucomicrobiae bacterium]